MLIGVERRRVPLLRFFRNGLQGITYQAGWLPFIKKDCAQFFIKVDRWSVPVQHFPAHAEVTLFPSDPGHVREQRLTDAVLAEVRAHIKIVKKQPGTPL